MLAATEYFRQVTSVFPLTNAIACTYDLAAATEKRRLKLGTDGVMPRDFSLQLDVNTISFGGYMMCSLSYSSEVT